MHLELQRELTDPRFAEMGRPYRIFRNEPWGIVALCSAFTSIWWPGRLAYRGQRILHRVSVYSASTWERIAVLDVHYPVNDIAFHPSEPRVAIGTGSYDGGYYYQGELLLWDWSDSTCLSLLKESREVVRCRFEGDHRLAILLRPRHEEEYWQKGYELEDPYTAVILDDLRPASEVIPGTQSGDPRLANLEPVDPQAWEFQLPKSYYSLTFPASDLQELQNHGFEERELIWDILWLSDQTFAAVHQRCHAELWNLDRGRLVRHDGPGNGVELLRSADGGCLVHVFKRKDWRTTDNDRSALYRLGENDLELVREFDKGYSFSSNSRGEILARDTGDPSRREYVRTDRLLNSKGETLMERDLGSFDSLNHALRLQGDEYTYFLRGTPPTSYQNKVLCSVDKDGCVNEVLRWEQGDEHITTNVSAFISEQEIIRACEVRTAISYSRLERKPEVYSKASGRIEALSLKDGGTLWSTPVEGCFIALAVMKSLGCVAFAQTNGNLGLVELSSGRILSQFHLVLDGISSIATALAARGDRLIVGTIEGRLLLFQVDRG